MNDADQKLLADLRAKLLGKAPPTPEDLATVRQVSGRHPRLGPALNAILDELAAREVMEHQKKQDEIMERLLEAQNERIRMLKRQRDADPPPDSSPE